MTTRRYLLMVMVLLGILAANGQPDVRVAKYYGDREGALTFTFDDGLGEHYTEVFPRLKALGLKASFGIIGSKVGREWKGVAMMTWAQLREMAADGQEITSHGYRHNALIKLQGEALRYEVQHNDTLISDSVGVFPRTYFYPGNRKTDEGVAFCSRHRVGTRMFQGSFGSKRDSAWVQRTLQRTIKKHEWTVWMTHGISKGYDAFPDPQLLWNTLQQVAGMQDQLWICTLHDGLAYAAERDTVQLDIKQKGGKLTVTPSMALDKSLFCHPLTLVIDCDVAEALQERKRLAVKHNGKKSLVDFNPHGGTITIIQ
ncbi:MAG: polysaccharide deacetylase family protein [Prevotella sp.]|nr:polysaccharide deacetylase family protein [Prevotella sp.]